MKRVIKAYSKPRYGAEYCYDLKEALLDQGLTSGDILDHLMGYFASDEIKEALEDLARVYDIDMDKIL